MGKYIGYSRKLMYGIPVVSVPDGFHLFLYKNRNKYRLVVRKINPIKPDWRLHE